MYEKVYSDEFGYGVLLIEDDGEAIVSFDGDVELARAVKTETIERTGVKHELRMLSARRSGRGLASWDKGKSFNKRVERIMVRFYGKNWKSKVRMSDIL